MKRVLLGVAVVAPILAAAAAIVFLATFDLNRYKPQLVTLVARQTGRSFAIDGPIQFAPSLVPTVVAEGVRFGNAAWGQSRELAVVKRVEAQVALRPLLDRRIEVRRIVLSEAGLALEMNKEGLGNWVIRPKAGAVPPALSKARFAVDALHIERSTLSLRSQRTGAARQIGIEALDAQSPSPDQPIAVEMKLAYRDLPIALKGTLGSWDRLWANQAWPVALSGQIKEVPLAVQGEIGHPLQARGLKLKARLEAKSLAELGALAGQKLPAVAPALVVTTVSEARRGYALTGLAAKAGRSDLAGNLQLDVAGKRPTLRGELTAGHIDLTEFLPPPRKGARVFSTAPLPWDALRGIDAQGTLRAGRVKTHKSALTGVETRFALSGGKLKLDPLQAGAAGGRITGTVTVNATGARPTVDLHLRGSGLLPGQLPQFAGKGLQEARTDFTFDIAGRGRSVAEVMGSGNGRILVKMGPGRLPNNLASADLLLDTVRLLNPLSARDPYTNIECAVLNFDVKDGVAVTGKGVGVRTDKLTVLGGGTVDLKTERLDIHARPKPRRGIGLNVAALGDFVHLGGTLSDPHPVTDAQGVATAGFKVGAALATGGLSLLAEGLFDRATAEEEVCAIALGTKPLKSAQKPAGGEPASQPGTGKTTPTREQPRGLGEAVQGVFEKLFGR